MGFSVNEGYASAPGDIRAFDVRTGKEVWRFHTVPRPGEFGNDSWLGESWRDRGGANAWGGVRVDSKHALVFAGLGSAAHDFYGGDRQGNNLFANSVVALDARTGRRVWHQQLIRHDLWDYDIPYPPTLVSVKHSGKTIEAVAQATKTGYVFLFDRLTGVPLFDLTERPAPQSDVPGEKTAANQVYPVKPPPFVRQEFGEKDITDISPEAARDIRGKLQGMRLGSIFTPPSVQGHRSDAGFAVARATWSGASFDPITGLLYINANDMPWTVYVQEVASTKGLYAGKGISIFKDKDGFPGFEASLGYSQCH
ncbi:MAG: hypothetical protein WKF84_07190 [Pyrinomonadaceae bacterium]